LRRGARSLVPAASVSQESRLKPRLGPAAEAAPHPSVHWQRRSASSLATPRARIQR